MHHLLTARDPRDRFESFPELDFALLQRFSAFQPLAEMRPDVSPALSNLIQRCLDPDPRRRPDAQQLEIELGRLAPTGSKLFETVKRWSPTVGEMLGTALATFVRMLFGRPAPERRGSIPPASPSSTQVGQSQRPTIPCLLCRGQGVLRSGQTCPICRGTGYW
jgi:serine/threonine protein kinase